MCYRTEECDMQVCFEGLSAYFSNMQDFFEGKNTGFNNINEKLLLT